jgi:hypothetical protein
MARWVLRNAWQLVLRLGRNARRSLSSREVAVHGVCLLVLLGAVWFAISNPIVILVVICLLWVVGEQERRRSPGSKGALARHLEAGGKADDERRDRMAAWVSRERNEEEAPWKLDS